MASLDTIILLTVDYHTSIVARSPWFPLRSPLAIAGYVTVTVMTFDKQSNARRIEVES